MLVNKIDAAKIHLGGKDAFGLTKVALFEGSLAGTDTASAYADNDCLVQLGALDVSTPENWTGPAPTKIVVQADIDFNAAGVTIAGYLPVIDIAKDQLYACTTTTLNADASAGRFTVQLRYTII